MKDALRLARLLLESVCWLAEQGMTAMRCERSAMMNLHRCRSQVSRRALTRVDFELTMG